MHLQEFKRTCWIDIYNIDCDDLRNNRQSNDFDECCELWATNI